MGSKCQPDVIVGWEGDSPTSSGRILVPKKTKRTRKSNEGVVHIDLPFANGKRPGDEEAHSSTPPMLKGLRRATDMCKRSSDPWQSTPPSQKRTAQERDVEREVQLNSLRTRLEAKPQVEDRVCGGANVTDATQHQSESVCDSDSDSFLANDELWVATQAKIEATFPPSPVVKNPRLLTRGRFRDADETPQPLNSPPAESNRPFDLKSPSAPNHRKISPVCNSTPHGLKGLARAQKLRLNSSATANEPQLAKDAFDDKVNNSDDIFLDEELLAQIDQAVAKVL